MPLARQRCQRPRRTVLRSRFGLRDPRQNMRSQLIGGRIISQENGHYMHAAFAQRLKFSPTAVVPVPESTTNVQDALGSASVEFSQFTSLMQPSIARNPVPPSAKQNTCKDHNIGRWYLWTHIEMCMQQKSEIEWLACIRQLAWTACLSIFEKIFEEIESQIKNENLFKLDCPQFWQCIKSKCCKRVLFDGIITYTSPLCW